MKASTVVVGYDGSLDGRAALDEAIAHVRDDGVIHVVTVHHPPATEHSGRAFGELPGEFRYPADVEEAERSTLRTAELRLGDVRHETHLRRGHPAAEILDLADEVDADLIVIGSRGLGRVERFLRGSVSTRVANHARTSTLIIHQERNAA